jgi:hypothetical protein
MAGIGELGRKERILKWGMRSFCFLKLTGACATLSVKVDKEGLFRPKKKG